MARNVYFSFHYDRDAWRASIVRNSNVISNYDKTYTDSAEWEAIKKASDDAVRKWITEQLKGTSVTVVLIGKETSTRKWVQYEIEKSIELGKGLLGIYINKIENSKGETDEPGANPLPSKYPTYLWNNDAGRENLGKWIEKAATAAGL
jgi:hypothetical protein